MLKKTLLMFGASLFAGLNPVSAQWSAGLAGGATATLWNWQLNTIGTSIGYDPGFGWRAAAQLEYQATSLASVRAELANQKISNRITNVTDQNGTLVPNSWISENYNTIGGSVLLKLSPGKKEHGAYFLGGPTLACITNGWRRWSAGLAEVDGLPRRQKLQLSEYQIRRLQWFADVGLGYDLELRSNHHLTAEFRYQVGLQGFSRSPFVSSRVQTAVLTFGYMRRL